MDMRVKKNMQGFTLIELLIVVAIIGILFVVAMPAYNSFIQKARRAEAKELILEMADRQEGYLLDARGYTDSLTNLNFTHSEWACDAGSCSNRYYMVTVVVDNAATPPTFTITAAPTALQAEDGTLTYTNLGVKTRTVGGVELIW